MKSNIRLLLIAVTVSLVAFFGWNVRGQQTSVPKVVWEHAVVGPSTGDNSSNLNQLGAEGWELVAVRSEEKTTGFTRTEVTYYFKRPRSTAK